jgi:leucyl-tRNA synthetase
VIDEGTGELKLRPDADAEIEKLLHRTTAKVQEDIDRLAFNTAIAALIKLVNEAGAVGLSHDQASRFVRLLAPFTPHVAEELWHKLGERTSIALAPWPAFDPAQLVDDAVQMPIAIKGKVRSHLTVPKDATPAQLEQLARADARVQELIAGKTVHKVIVVPGRMINFVAD